MDKKEKAMFILTEPKIQLLVTLGGVAILLFGVIVTINMAPVQQSTAINAKGIEINELNISRLEKINQENAIRMESRLIRIEDKVDKILEVR